MITLRFVFSELDQAHIDGVISILEKIKKDHLSLFQQIEIVFNC